MSCVLLFAFHSFRCVRAFEFVYCLECAVHFSAACSAAIVFSRQESDAMFCAGFSSYCVKDQSSYGDGGSLMRMVMTAMNEAGA